MWVREHNAAVVFTGIEMTRNHISKAFSGELALGMPLFAGDNKTEFEESTDLGDMMIDLDKGQSWFYGAEGKTLDFEVEVITPKAADKSQTKSSSGKAKIRKVKMAQMQDQRIRVLEMEEKAA
jgi:hypothetical protein